MRFRLFFNEMGLALSGSVKVVSIGPYKFKELEFLPVLYCIWRKLPVIALDWLEE